MRRIMALLLVGLLLVACGGGGDGAEDPEVDPGSSEDPGVTLPPDDGGGSGGSDGIPSGAKLRLFNAYADPDGTPVTLDLYPEPWVDTGVAPLLSVDYGTLSPVFDPTVADEAGNMFLSAYASGETGNGNSVMSIGETLDGTEVITYVVARGTGEMSNGRAGSISQAFFDPTIEGTDGETPAPGKGRVVISAVGLDNVLDGERSWFASFGSGCALGVNDTEWAGQLVSPGTSGASYDLDPGSYTLSLHPYDTEPVPPTCAGTPDEGGFDVPVEPGKVTLVFLYAATPDELKAVAIPLSVP